MARKKNTAAHSHSLPLLLRSLFWDVDFAALTWEDDRELIIARVLTAGSWDAVTWLRAHVGDRTVQEWIERHQGGALSPKQLRFWELILGLPHRQVNTWLARQERQIWDTRADTHTSTPRA